MSPAFYFWVVLAVLFVAAELHSVAFFAVFGAAGSVAAAIVALFAEDAYALQIAGSRIAIAVLGIVLVRPYVSKAFEGHGPDDRIGGVHGGLISARGITIDVVGNDTSPSGHVRILGETWLAVTAIGEPIPPQTPVIVTAITGTTLTVRPQDGTTAKAE